MANPTRAQSFVDVLVGQPTKATDINKLADDTIQAFTEYDGGDTASLPASPVVFQRYMDNQADILYACFDAGTWHPIASDFVHVLGTAIGVGTNDPKATAHILESGTAGTPALAGAAAIGAFQRTATAGGSAFLYVISHSSGTAGILFGDEADADVGQVLYDHSNNSLDFHVNVGEKATINSLGQFGVGVISPEVLFHTQTTGSDTNFLILEGDRNVADTEVGILFKDRSAIAGGQEVARIWTDRQGSTGNFDLVFQAGDQGLAGLQNESIRIQGDTGNVGIGETPGDKFSVAGRGSFDQAVSVDTTGAIPGGVIGFQVSAAVPGFYFIETDTIDLNLLMVMAGGVAQWQVRDDAGAFVKTLMQFNLNAPSLSMQITSAGDLSLAENIDLATGKFVGLGSAAGRFVFTDLATDTIDVLNADFLVNGNKIVESTGNHIIPSGGFAGISGTAGRIIFTDAATDTINIASADFQVGGTTRITSGGVATFASLTAGGTQIDASGDVIVTAGDFVGLSGNSRWVFNSGNADLLGATLRVNGNNKIDSSGNIIMQDLDWIGLGSAAGRIVFDDAATDIVDIRNAALYLGGTEIVSTGRVADFVSLDIGGTELINSGGNILLAIGDYIGSNLSSNLTRNSSSRFDFNGCQVRVINQGLVLGSPTGGDKGGGTLNVATDIYKNNTAYTNPDYVFENYFTGECKEQYTGLPSLDFVESFVREHHHLPGISRKSSGIFERGDMVLEKVEELYLYSIELSRRLDSLEADIRKIVEKLEDK